MMGRIFVHDARALEMQYIFIFDLRESNSNEFIATSIRGSFLRCTPSGAWAQAHI